MANHDVDSPSDGRRVVTDGGFDPDRALELATNKEPADLIADIVGHPAEAPSVEELSYMNPELDETTIRRHLSALVGAEVVRERSVVDDVPCRDPPEAWYEITDSARDCFEQEGVFASGAWRREYESVTKTDRIKTLEQLPR